MAGGRRWWWWSHVWLQSYGLGGPFYGNWVHTSLLRSDRNTTKCCSGGNSLISSAAPSWIMDRLGLIVFCTVPISHVYSYPRARNYKMCQCIWLTRLLPTLPSDGTHGLIVVLQDDEEGGMLKSSTVRLHYSNLKVHRIPIQFLHWAIDAGVQRVLYHIFLGHVLNCISLRVKYFSGLVRYMT